MLKGPCRVIAIVALAGLAPLVHGEGSREVGWEDLLPEALQALEKEADALQDRIAKLAPDERKIYDDVALELTARESLERNTLSAGDLSEETQAVLEREPSKSAPEALAFWTRVREMKEELENANGTIRTSLNGEQVRIPGYLLPLEYEGTQVSEFLLVPYVGACIHVPPPPANQMVYVKVSEAIENTGMYEPVWVEGRIFAKPASYDLSLSDGSAPVDAGYSLDASKVEPYEF